jgi:tRNA wybutosine-synthesizing protein 4
MSWLLTRFGATWIRFGSHIMLLGGVARDHLLGHQDEALLCLSLDDDFCVSHRLQFDPNVWEGDSIPRPLYVGHSALPMPDGSVVIVGGGATCFSMGTFWNKGVYTLRVQTLEDLPPAPRWVHEKTVDIVPTQRSPPAARKRQEAGKPPRITPIPRVKLEAADDFLKIVREGKPVVLEGLDLGSCVSAWTLDNLVDKVGADREVSIYSH